jgi:hypothetical protein
VSTRTIQVINTPVIKSGTNRNGNAYCLREVIATNPEGAPITEKLKTFDDAIVAGEQVEVDVERQDDPQWGPSYMLRKAGGGAGGGSGGSPGARLGPKVDELRDRLERLEGKVGELLTEIERLVADAARSGQSVPRGPDPAELAITGAPPRNAIFGDEEDIPF